MQKFRIPYIPYRSLLLSTTVLNDYACLQAHVNKALTWQSSCVIANKAQKTARLFVQGYNLKVYDVINTKTLCYCN